MRSLFDSQPDRRPALWPKRRRHIAKFVVLGMLCLLAACQPGEVTETESFEKAEVAYRDGRYKSAIDDYERFLVRYPHSPLAEVAELRIRTISREIQSMLGRTATPPPLYRGEAKDAIKNAQDD